MSNYDEELFARIFCSALTGAIFTDKNQQHVPSVINKAMEYTIEAYNKIQEEFGKEVEQKIEAKKPIIVRQSAPFKSSGTVKQTIASVQKMSGIPDEFLRPGDEGYRGPVRQPSEAKMRPAAIKQQTSEHVCMECNGDRSKEPIPYLNDEGQSVFNPNCRMLHFAPYGICTNPNGSSSVSKS